jgi:tRNA(adenine34) deaminase
MTADAGTTASAADERFMAEALDLAAAAEREGEVPVGAVLVVAGAVVARAGNAPIGRHDPTAHAEILVLREAGARLGNYRLPGSTLYVTLEPCPMCAAALVHARVERLVYGAADPKSGAAGSIMNLVQDPRLNHRLSVDGGVLAGEAAALLQQFFRSRRGGEPDLR